MRNSLRFSVGILNKHDQLCLLVMDSGSAEQRIAISGAERRKRGAFVKAQSVFGGSERMLALFQVKLSAEQSSISPNMRDRCERLIDSVSD